MNDPAERRSLIAIVLCLAVFFLWTVMFPQAAPPPEDPAATAPAATAPIAAAPVPAAVEPDVPCSAAAVPVGTAIAALAVAPCGGGLSGIVMVDEPAPLTVTPWWTWAWRLVSFQRPGGWTAYEDPQAVESLLGSSGRFAHAGVGAYVGPRGTWETGTTGATTTLRRTTGEGVTITQMITPSSDPDVFAYTVRWESGAAVPGPVWVGLADEFPPPVDTYDPLPRPAGVVEGDLYTWPTSGGCGGATGNPPGPVSWFGVQDRYFLAALIPEAMDWGQLRTELVAPHPNAGTVEPQVGLFLVRDGPLAPGVPVEAKFTLYAGPKGVERLEALGHDLQEAASLGIFGFFSRVLLFFLRVLHAGIGNWGFAIIALTFTVRLAFYPLSAKAFRSGKAMSAIQPKLKALQEKFADDREALQRETMSLFKDNGVNPLGGCLPMLLQMPVFFALYTALLTTPDLYHADFLYVRDLSMPDPYGIFPAVMAVGMVLQQRMTPLTGMDPQQAQMMKIMPFVFALFMFGLPAGLSLYYSVNTGLAILQQWYNTRSWDAEQVPAVVTVSTPPQAASQPPKS